MLEWKIVSGTIKKLNEGLKYPMQVHTRTYADKETGEIWTISYSDCNSYTQYKNKNIFEVNMGFVDIGDYGFKRWNKAQVIKAVERTLEYMGYAHY